MYTGFVTVPSRNYSTDFAYIVERVCHYLFIDFCQLYEPAFVASEASRSMGLGVRPPRGALRPVIKQLVTFLHFIKDWSRAEENVNGI